MITMTLTDGTILRYNLKDTPREKALRDAWYSMQDMKRAQSKKLKIVTDKQITYQYEIKEIKDCIYEDKTFLYDTPSVIKPKKVEPVTVNKDAESSFRNIIKNDQDKFKAAVEKISEGLQDIFDSIPDQYKENLQRFIQKLKDGGIGIDIFSHEAMDVITNAMTCDEYLLDQYVEEYKKLWHKNKNKI